MQTDITKGGESVSVRKKAGGTAGPRVWQHTERQRQAVELRKAGATFEDIGRRLGISTPAAHGLVHRALQRWAENLITDTTHVKAMQLARLDEALAEAWAILKGDHVLVQGGRVVEQYVTDDDGRRVVDIMSRDEPPGYLMKPVLDQAPKLAAIDRILKIEERRASLLGLDAAKVPTNGGAGLSTGIDGALPTGTVVQLVFEAVEAHDGRPVAPTPLPETFEHEPTP